MWQLGSLREGLINLAEEVEVTNQQVKGLIKSIRQLIRWATDPQSDPQTTDREVPDKIQNDVRVELFKLFYEKSEFVLNEKADATETLQALLSCIHVYHFSKNKSKANIEFSKALDYECDGYCLVHSSVGLTCKVYQVCENCGPHFKVQQQDNNLFAMTINAAEILSLMPQDQNVFANHKKLSHLYSTILTSKREGTCGSKKKPHKVQTVVSLDSDPSVLIFNVSWLADPGSSSIAKFMITIPSIVHRDEIF